MNIQKSTSDYERWLATQLEIVPADLLRKHEQMTSGVFPFLRSTFYRWAQVWPEVCADCASAPKVLAVGDLHVENFGTWRDVEGRLIWGINDFDEATRMPYTIDLVRLATSAHLAIDEDKLRIDHEEACGAILAGYREGLASGGMPFVLAGKHQWLRAMVMASIGDGAAFWEKLTSLPPYHRKVPGDARRALEKLMPGRISEKWQISHRVAGLGSLGRQRFVAVADYAGGLVCREAKALALSAWDFEQDTGSTAIRYQKALDSGVRAEDPFVRLQQGKWIVRRLAPDCTRVDLARFPKEGEQNKLLHAMGWETANLHTGSGQTKKALADMDRRPQRWLHQAAGDMVNATRADWKEWANVKAAGKSTAGN